ncbi:MAG TPA: HAD-IA family hydrolase [Verrucomicrobiae bacterium]|nr:HAD-IA family hydrolase [Verrucomicrobiae bacterium]HTZ55855.1 HAD-IA family hydrolase [Candidatus Acidoferrum sp.]
MELSYAGICLDLFGTLVTDGGGAVDGARETLAALGSERWAIVTSCSRGFAFALIARAGLTAPPVLVGADDVTRGKPAPDPYALAAKRLAVEPARTLVVEDSASGVDAAHAAGMEAVYVLCGRPASACARADYYVARFDQIGVALGAGGTFLVSLP